MSGERYKVFYVPNVVDFLVNEITSERVYEAIDAYREILAVFPYIGAEYEPQYSAGKPAFPCRFIPVPNTPFTLYYEVCKEDKVVNVLAIMNQRRKGFF